jgi:hypothetical protein
MTPEQSAALGATMIDQKMEPEVASRAINSVTSALVAPENLSKKAKTALGDVVGPFKEFSKLSGNQKLMRFVDKLHDMSSQQRSSKLGAILGAGFSDEMLRVVTASEELHRNADMAEKAMLHGSDSIARIAEQRMKLLNSQIKILQNNANEIAERLGSIILPPLNDALTSANQYASDRDAQKAALAGMSSEDARAQSLEYDRRWTELHKHDKQPGDINLRRRVAYNKDLAGLGRGELKDLFDNLDADERQRFLNDHGYNQWPDEAQRRFPANNELPTADHHYSIKDLPKNGPMPGGRPAPPASDLSGQYSQYHAGIEAMRKVQSLTPLPDLGDLHQTLANSDALAASGQATWRAAGEVIDQSSAQAADAISKSGDRAGGALDKAIDSVVGSLLGLAAKIAGINTNPKAAGGNIPMDHNPGRSMPPSVTSPSTGNGGGSNGGGGF